MTAIRTATSDRTIMQVRQRGSDPPTPFRTRKGVGGYACLVDTEEPKIP
jgi:hypothetical protein